MNVKRSLSILLAALLCVSLLPGTALASGGPVSWSGKAVEIPFGQADTELSFTMRPGDYAGLTAEGGALTCGEDTIPYTVELKDAYGGTAPLQFLAGESFTATISIAETAFETAPAGVYTGELLFFGTDRDGNKLDDCTAVPLSLTAQVYTVILDPGDGSGTPIPFRSTAQTDLPGWSDAGYLQFYINDTGDMGFRLDSEYCPDSFTAPKGYEFNGWDKSGLIPLNDPVTTCTARWRKTGTASITLTPDALSLSFDENGWMPFTVTISELNFGPNAKGISQLNLTFLSGFVSLQNAYKYIDYEIYSADHDEGGRYLDWTAYQTGSRALALKVDPQALAAAAPGIYTGELNYRLYWESIGGSPASREGSIPLSLTVPSVTVPGDTAHYRILLDGGVTAWVDGQQVTEAPEGAAVTLRVTPPEGQGLTGLTVTTELEEIPVPLDGFTFTMPAEDVRVSATFREFVGTSNWEELKRHLEEGAYVRLTGDVIRTDDSSLRGSGTLDLNGFRLDGGEGNGRRLISGSYDSYVTLTIRDNSPGQTGTILYHGGPVIDLRSRGSFTLAGGSILPAEDVSIFPYVVQLQDGSRFTMTGGSITGNDIGVALSSRSSSFTMTGGSVTGNDIGVALSSGSSSFTMTGGSVTGNSSGVEMGDDCRFTMTGGSVTGNNIGVSMHSNCSFTMTGGSITGNKTTGIKGDGSVSLSGSPVVTGNDTASWNGNVKLDSGRTVTVTGPLEEGAALGVRMGEPGVFAEPGEGYTLTEGDISHFSSDDPAYTVVLNSEGKAELVSVTPGGWPPESGMICRIIALEAGTRDMLKGAEIAIYEKGTGKEIDCWVSEENPHESRVTEKETVYILRVLNAPEGYEKPDDNEFMINQDGDSITVLSGPCEIENGGISLILSPSPPGWPPPAVFPVTFDANAHGKPSQVVTVPAGEPVEKPEDPTADGYVFGGWYLEPDCLTPYDFSTPVTAELVLYAKWTARSSHSGGGRGSVTYAVNVEKAENGSVTASGAYAAAGKTVTLTVKPDEGYQLDKLTVTDKNGQEVAVTSKEDGSRTFTMPGSAVTVAASFAAETPAPEPEPEPEPGGEGCPKDETCPVSAFTDASPDAWYHDGVHWALENGVMNGTGETTFDPNGSTTRAMVVTMLWRLEGKPTPDAPAPFTDVEPGAWYADAVAWAAESGVVKGITQTEFAPNAPVTREQLAAILYRCAQAKGQGFTGMWYFPLDVTDAAEVSEYADEAMHWMVMKGIIQGRTETTLNPKDQTSRAETATILMRYLTVIGAES